MCGPIPSTPTPAKFLKLIGLVVDSVQQIRSRSPLQHGVYFLQAARDHEDDHHSRPKKLGRDCD